MMKRLKISRLSAFILLTSLFPLLVNSTEVGIKIGFHHSDFPDYQSYENHIFRFSSFKIGFFLQSNWRNHFQFQAEVYFHQLGMNRIRTISTAADLHGNIPGDAFLVEGLGDNPDVYIFSFQDTLSYLEIPLLVSYRILSKNTFSPFLTGGVSTSVRISPNRPKIDADVAAEWLQENHYYLPGLQVNDEFDVGRYNRFEGGLIAGAGVTSSTDKVRWSCEFRINFGFIPIYREFTADGIEPHKNKTMGFLFSLTF